MTPFETVADAVEARRRIAGQLLGVRAELRIAHPGGTTRGTGPVPGLLPGPDSAVRVRLLLPNAARVDAETLAWVTAAVRAGALVRTVPAPPRPLIVADRELAVLPAPSGDPAGGTMLIREPNVVGHLIATFDAQFAAGTPLTVDPVDEAGAAVNQAGAAAADRVLGLLAAGATEEEIAQRLGLSARAGRRLIAATLAALGTTHPFQAGLLAEKRGLLE
ncbi:hypothetical protein [Actinoplanes sp. NPDC051859]|uniref:hypothetical protein n=1 Tax=Actinoplanes sp. NPDC051859 TaxID=3363909 RepID=UPI0037B15C45